MKKATSNYTKIKSLIEHRRLGEAILLVEELVHRGRVGSQIDKLNDIKMNYDLLVHYFLQNVNDPHRFEIFDNLIRKTHELSDEAYEVIQQYESDVYDYKEMRIHRAVNQIDDIKGLLFSFERYGENLLSREDYEKSQRHLFNAFWLESFYSIELCDLYKNLLQGSYSSADKCLAVSALTLSLFRYFAPEKVELLFEASLNAAVDVQMRALVGLCFVFVIHDEQHEMYSQCWERLGILNDNVFLMKKCEQIVTQIIRTSETERVVDKMNNDIIPALLKAFPGKRNKVDINKSLDEIDFMEQNPEWSEFLQEGGVDKKMQEIADLQQEGADVYMGTFASLKALPFFQESYRWFLKFDKKNTEVASIFQDKKGILDAFVGSTALCNSDKYSFCMAIKQMPLQQQEDMGMSFNAEMEQLADDMQHKQISDENISNQYVQELYRYYKLNKRLLPQNDIFKYSLLIHTSAFFEKMFSDQQSRLQIAKFYFQKKYYRQALVLFSEYENIISDAEICQKIAYCYQQEGQLAKALEFYERANLIFPNNIWTLKRMASCARLLGNVECALGCYEQILQQNPNEKQSQLNMVYCLLDENKVTEALDLCYKLEFECHGDLKVIRALAWCTFMAKQYERSEFYWAKVLQDKPTNGDYLNAGHVSWFLSKREIAMQYYLMSKQMSPDVSDFRKNFQADKNILVDHGMLVEEYNLLVSIM